MINYFIIISFAVDLKEVYAIFEFRPSAKLI